MIYALLPNKQRNSYNHAYMLLKRCYLTPWTNSFVCNFELEIIQESFSVHTQTSMAFIAKELKATTKMKMQMYELGATGPPWRQRVRERERIRTFVVSRACVWKNMKYVYKIVWVDHTRIDHWTSWFGRIDYMRIDLMGVDPMRIDLMGAPHHIIW